MADPTVPRSARSDEPSPPPPTRPHRAHPPRRHRRRRLRVAARQGRPRGRSPTSRPRTPTPRQRTAHLAALREPIFDEIKARTQETDLSVPDPRSATTGTTRRTVEGKQYGASCRVPGRRPRRLDPAARSTPTPTLARRGGAARPQRAGRGPRLLLARRASSVSPDGHLLAYSHRHRRRRALHAAGQGPRAPASCCPTRSRTRSAARPGTADGDARSSTRPSTTPGAPTRSGGTGSARPRPTTSLVHHEPDERFWVGVGRTRSDRFLVDRARLQDHHASTASSTPTTPTGEFRGRRPAPRGRRVLRRARRDRRRGPASSSCTTTAPRTSSSRTAPVDADPPEQWQPLIPHDPAVRLEDVDAFAGHLVVTSAATA